ncbi:probable LRR receptor-like serine/threonine-protein kinase At1g06840 [Olea europaea var. sylvestris]|uniref:probable LRR receptor-like serine/threonine-protein kinase At1g06840 n=1 Tax=Olea europaea var. sylvestris TaxID=158386 RepID=UPI000C1D4DB1|nr:probable LRR receptor-like serine/threonine-protein kinase At1g06840 [Olea europaea var. sylvestris]
MTRKYDVYCRKSMRQDYSSYMVTVHFKSFLYKLVSRSDIISGHQTNDKKCWKGLNLAILNHFIFLQSNYFSPFKLFCFTITCCYTLLSQKSLVYRVFFIMQMLIYEFMSNGNLRDHLSGNSKVPLTFAMRLRIALGSAKGILYLHMEANPPIYHRDIKASNILLDPRFTAKVADFGLSRLAPVPELEGLVPAHVSTVVKGTPGYLDPEYFLTHKLTDKSDVYSLGVVFLELLTAMHPIYHGKNIVREVNIAYSSGMIFSIIDDRMGSYPSECAMKFMKLALNCCHDDTDTRPSMVEVVRELESIWLMMPESDTMMSESVVSGPEKMFTPTSSSSTLKTSYVSQDISGSDLAFSFFFFF